MSAGTISRATLTAGDISTEYLRAGNGGTVLLLIAEGGDSPVALAMLGALAQRHRVIAPVQLPTGTGLLATLAQLIECLGVASLAIVADGEHRAPALEYAAGAGGAVTRVALLGSVDGAAAGAVPDGAAAAVLVPPRTSDGVIDAGALATAVAVFIGGGA